MSKYIIELDDRIKLVTSVGVTEHGVVYTTSGYVHNLEELNSDYINEHFSDLQDAAYKKGLHDGESKCRYCNEYQRGFEDGKAVNDKGCEGCMWEGNPYDACEQCSNAHKNLWTAMQKTDEIKVGDEMKQVTESGTETGLRCTVTASSLSLRVNISPQQSQVNVTFFDRDGQSIEQYLLSFSARNHLPHPHCLSL